MSFAEAVARPEVNAAFARPLLREFDDGDTLWPEIGDERQPPKPEGQCPRGRNRGYDIEIRNGYDEHQN